MVKTKNLPFIVLHLLFAPSGVGSTTLQGGGVHITHYNIVSAH